jgi:sodium transport system permease protein
MDIAGKEILSTVRDRRAIVSNLLVPLFLLPLMMLGLPLALGGLFSREQAALTPVAVQGLEAMPGDLEQLLVAANLQLTESADPEAAVREGAADLGMIVPPAMAERLAARERVELPVFSKHGNLRAEVAASKVVRAVEGYRAALVGERLREAGLDPALLEPLAVRPVDVSSSAERSSGQLSWLIPFFIAIWTLVGGQMTAIDATAGEKERGTLESLLVAPVKRSEVVVGKFLATVLFGLTAALMAIAGYLGGGLVLRALIGSRLEGEGAEIVALMGGSLQVTPQSVGLLLMSTVLLAATVAALLIGVTMFARSFKEAQSYVAPLSFLLIVPSLILQFEDLLDLGRGIYLVPVVNVLLLMDDTVKGAAEAGPVLLTWLSLLALIAALLAFALRNFNRESVIFRT